MSNQYYLLKNKTKHRCKESMRKTWHIVVHKYWLPPSLWPDVYVLFWTNLSSLPSWASSHCDIVLIFVSPSLPNPTWAISRLSPNPNTQHGQGMCENQMNVMEPAHLGTSLLHLVTVSTLGPLPWLVFDKVVQGARRPEDNEQQSTDLSGYERGLWKPDLSLHPVTVTF